MNALILVPDAELKKGFIKSYQTVKDLESSARAGSRVSILALVKPLMGTINKGAFLQCDPVAYNEFLAKSSEMLRSVIEAVTTEEAFDPQVLKSVQEGCSWLCSMAAAGPANEAVKGQVGSAWVLSQLSEKGTVLADTASCVNEISAALEPLNLPQESLLRIAQTEIVVVVARNLTSKIAPDEAVVNTAREWCRGLLVQPVVSPDLQMAAKKFGLNVQGNLSDSGDQTSQSTKPRYDPNIFRSPELIPEDEVISEFEQCLMLLLGVSAEDMMDKELWDKLTASKVEQLSPDANIEQSVVTLFNAASGLWTAFWKHGDGEALEISRTLARFVYSFRKGHNAPPPYRTAELYLLMSLQLPELCRTANFESLRADALLLFRSEGCPFQSPIFSVSIMQAHAGQYRMLESRGEKDDADELLMLNGEQLRDTHKEYEKIQRDRNSEERNIKTEVWNFLAHPLIDILGDDDEQRTKVDDVFVGLVNRGNTKDVYDYLESQVDNVRTALEQKLVGYRLSGDHLMEPIGTVYMNSGPHRHTPLPLFESAKRLLAEGVFARAAGEFDEIASRKGIPPDQQQISKDYQGYAFAKKGVFIQAKGPLREVIQSSHRSAAAFWNLACIEGDRSAQISILSQGLQRAPHMNMLNALIYLYVILDQSQDEQACRWLALLPVMEAQMLMYHHEYNRLGDDEAGREKRENILKRISAYIEHGNPDILDPAKRRPRLTDLTHFIDSLKQRDHEEVIGFWFQCHEPFENAYKENRDRTDYYTAKTDILSDIGLQREAALSFEEEFGGHTTFLNILERGQRNVHPNVLATIRRRVETRLRSLLSPDLEAIGRRIYRTVKLYDETNRLGIQILQYGESQKNIHKALNPPPPPETLEQIISRVSQDTRSKLHSIADYRDQKPALWYLIDGLRNHQKKSSGDALQSLLEQWEQYQQHISLEERKPIMAKADSALTLIQGCFQRELSPTEVELANGVLTALTRVNGRLAQGAKEQPKIKVVALAEAPPPFSGDANPSTFALRVSSMPGSAEVRLTDASIRMRDKEATFVLYDNLSDFPVMLSPTNSVVLTFEETSNLAVTDTCVLDLEFSYELAGQRYSSSAISTSVTPRPYSFEHISSPYIFNRNLQPHEVDGHFFGRDKEETKIANMISSYSGRLCYIEGIRRTGKTSLFSSFRHHVTSENGIAVLAGRKIIPIHLKGGSVSSFSQVGQILDYFFSAIVQHPDVSAAGVIAPSEDACCSNLTKAYSAFEQELRSKLPESTVVAMWDDFQEIVDLASYIGTQHEMHGKIKGLLEVIRERRETDSKLVWLLAGFRARSRFPFLFPGVNMWAELETVSIDFLDTKAVGDIIISPLKNTGIHVPNETIARVYQMTSGHPEVVQRVADKMLEIAQEENRPVLTPVDADRAVNILGATPGLFADTWCPLGELSENQKKLIGLFLSAVPPISGKIEPHQLVAPQNFTDTDRKDVDDLVARKIMDRFAGGAIAVKAPVLELWLRGHWKDEAPPSTAAIFLDAANLTQGTGNDEVIIDGLDFGDVVAGKFKLKTILDTIDRYASMLTPAPIAEKWAINYPKGSMASSIANLYDYQLENIPEDIMIKGQAEGGSDDTILLGKLAEIMADRPAISHVVLVTGDKDFRVVGVELQLRRGKNVHVVTTKAAGARSYTQLSRSYPERCKVVFLEDLLSAQRAGKD